MDTSLYERVGTSFSDENLILADARVSRGAQKVNPFAPQNTKTALLNSAMKSFLPSNDYKYIAIIFNVFSRALKQSGCLGTHKTQIMSKITFQLHITDFPEKRNTP